MVNLAMSEDRWAFSQDGRTALLRIDINGRNSVAAGRSVAGRQGCKLCADHGNERRETATPEGPDLGRFGAHATVGQKFSTSSEVIGTKSRVDSLIFEGL